MDAERWHEVFRCKVKLAMRSQLKAIVARSVLSSRRAEPLAM